MRHRVPHFCNKRTTFDQITLKPQNTDGPKFADLSMAAVSLYFKGSMIHLYVQQLY